MRVEIITALEYDDNFVVGVVCVPEGRSFDEDARAFYSVLQARCDEILSETFRPSDPQTRREVRRERGRRQRAEMEAYRQAVVDAGCTGDLSNCTLYGMQPKVAELLVAHLEGLGYQRLFFRSHYADVQMHENDEEYKLSGVDPDEDGA
jgi:hypothetical protein